MKSNLKKCLSIVLCLVFAISIFVVIVLLLFILLVGISLLLYKSRIETRKSFAKIQADSFLLFLLVALSTSLRVKTLTCGFSIMSRMLLVSLSLNRF